jgi:cysteinyl-tRNA synthetase
MSRKYLGGQLDIHGGALDLIFPHHENEIAQSEALTGKQFVKYWMHTGFLQSSGEKMSKSLGNILPVRDFLKEFDANTFRLFILQTHYRSPIDYSKENVAEAGRALDRFKEFRKRVTSAQYGDKEKAKELADELKEDFTTHMDDDFNTPNAVSALFDFVRDVNNLIDEGKESKASLEYAVRIFDELTEALGLVLEEDIEVGEEIEKLVKEREDARQEKDWAKADEIRDELSEKGFKVIDNKDGSTRVEKL